MSRPAIPTATRQAALAAVRAGASYAEAARRTGISGHSVARVCREAGLPPRRPGAPGADDDIALAGRWVRDGLIWRHEGAA